MSARSVRQGQSLSVSASFSPSASVSSISLSSSSSASSSPSASSHLRLLLDHAVLVFLALAVLVCAARLLCAAQSPGAPTSRTSANDTGGSDGSTADSCGVPSVSVATNRSISNRSLAHQHTIWSVPLHITGAALNATTGEVFYSDAANNRVVHASQQSDVLDVYQAESPAFFSPMQLALLNNTLYVADSSNNRIVTIDVESGVITFPLPRPSFLGACTGVAVNPFTGDVYALDGWGLRLSVWSAADGQWGGNVDLAAATSALSPSMQYGTSMTLAPASLSADVVVYVVDSDAGRLYCVQGGLVTLSSLSLPGVVFALAYLAPQLLYVLLVYDDPTGQQSELRVSQYNLSSGALQRHWPSASAGSVTRPLRDGALAVSAQGDFAFADYGLVPNTPYGRVVLMLAEGELIDQFALFNGTGRLYSDLLYDATSASGGDCALWVLDYEDGLVRMAADGTVLQRLERPVHNLVGAQFTAVSFDLGSAALATNDSLVLIDNALNQQRLWRFDLTRTPSRSSHNFLCCRAAASSLILMWTLPATTST